MMSGPTDNVTLKTMEGKLTNFTLEQNLLKLAKRNN